jgi:predicted secreted hydrolase
MMRHRSRLAWVLAVAGACWFAAGGAEAGPPGGSDLDSIRSTAPNPGFDLVLQPRAFEFPRDHGSHPRFRHEWWYVTGNLDSSGGERFGFELTFFRTGLLPPGTGTGAGGGGDSAWHTRQLYSAHFAITDVARGQFHFAEKFSRDALGLAGAQAEPFRVWLDDWMLGVPDGASGHWKLHAQGQGYDLTLEVEPLLAPVLNGDRGMNRSADEPGAASYYYSIPRVAVHGQLARAGAVSDVRGLAWLDREWGTGSLGANEQGWDWFALQLQDGSTLMLYDLRKRDGTRDPHSAGTWVDPTGRARPLTAEEISIDVLDHWVSPAGGRYPSRWRVRIPVVSLDVEARPVLPNQELRTRPRYWEGAVDVRGTREGHSADGRGYVELVGYAE